MSMISSATREINCKVGYYVTDPSGNATDLEHICTKVDLDTKGKMTSFATETERTLFCDSVPVDLREVRLLGRYTPAAGRSLRSCPPVG